MRPITFHGEAGGAYRPVALTFAAESEVQRVRVWRKQTPDTAAGEFAVLAAKRWFDSLQSEAQLCQSTRDKAN
jgi:hypothetical protein